MSKVKVKMLNADVIGLASCLTAICKEGINFKPRTWFTLADNRKQLVEKGKLIDELNQKIVDKYSEKTEEGGIIIPEGNVSEFQKEKADVLTTEIEIDLHKISLSAIEKEMPKMKGVENILLLFQHVISDEKEKKPKSK